jgi:hypothetical protein
MYKYMHTYTHVSCLLESLDLGLHVCVYARKYVCLQGDETLHLCMYACMHVWHACIDNRLACVCEEHLRKGTSILNIKHAHIKHAHIKHTHMKPAHMNISEQMMKSHYRCMHAYMHTYTCST